MKLLSPELRRIVVCVLKDRFMVSQPRACWCWFISTSFIAGPTGDGDYRAEAAPAHPGAVPASRSLGSAAGLPGIPSGRLDRELQEGATDLVVLGDLMVVVALVQSITVFWR